MFQLFQYPYQVETVLINTSFSSSEIRHPVSCGGKSRSRTLSGSARTLQISSRFVYGNPGRARLRGGCSILLIACWCLLYVLVLMSIAKLEGL
jgi:hypothetical protein